MAGIDEKVVIPIEVNSGQARSELSSLSQAFQNLSGHLGSTGAGLGALAGGAAAGGFAFSALSKGVTETVGAFRDFIGEARSAEMATQRLAVMVNSTGNDFGVARPQIEGWIEGIKKISSLSTKSLENGLSALLVHTTDLAQAQRMSTIAVNIAAAKGEDYLEVVSRLGLALEGNVRGLRAYGLTAGLAAAGGGKAFMDMTIAQRGTYIELAAAEKNYSNASKDLMNTGAQQVQLLKTSVEELKVAIGGAFAGTGLLHFLSEVIQKATLAVSVLQALGYIPGGGKYKPPTSAPENDTGAGVPAYGKYGTPKAGENASDFAVRVAREKAELEAAEKAALAYNEAVKVLLGTDEKAAISDRILGTALQDLTKKLGDSTLAARAFGPELAAAELKAARLGNTLSANLQKFVIQGPYAMDPAGLTSKLVARDMEDAKKLAEYQERVKDWFLKGGEGLDKFLAEDTALWRQIGEEMASPFKKIQADLKASLSGIFSGAATDIFADLAQTGGKNFGQIAAQTFNQATTTGAKSLVGVLAQFLGSAFGGGKAPVQGRDAQGNAIWTFEGSTQEFATQQGAQSASDQQAGQALIGKGVAAAQFGSMIAGSISGKNVQSDLSLILTGAATGFTIGGWVGAIVGAVVGAFAAILSPGKGASYQYTAGYGVPVGIGGGVAEGAFNKNVTDATAKKWLRSMQETYDGFMNGYIGLLEHLDMQFTDALRDATLDFHAAYTAAGDDLAAMPGAIGREASEKFGEKLEQWINETLPTEIENAFKGDIAKGFEGIGFTIDAFNDIWDHLKLLDRSKQIQLLGQLADAGKEIKKALEFFATEVAPHARIAAGVGGANYLQYTSPGGGGLLAQVAAEARRSFAQVMAESDKNILKLGANLNNLTGEAQILRAKELGDLMTKRMEDEKTYLLSIQQGMKAITDSLQQSVRSLTLEGFRTLVTDPTTGAKSYKTDYAAQGQYLKSHADDLMQQLALATNPQEVQALTGEIQQTIMQIRAIGANLGPEADELYRKWALDQLKTVEKAAHDQMMKLAKEVEDQNKAFTDAIHGFIDAFLGATAALHPYIPPPKTVPPVNGVCPAGYQLSTDGTTCELSRSTLPILHPRGDGEGFGDGRRIPDDPNDPYRYGGGGPKPGEDPTSDPWAFMEATVAAHHPTPDEIQKEFDDLLKIQTGGNADVVAVLEKIHAVLSGGRDVRVVMDDLNITVDTGGGAVPNDPTRTIRGRG